MYDNCMTVSISNDLMNGNDNLSYNYILFYYLMNWSNRNLVCNKTYTLHLWKKKQKNFLTFLTDRHIPQLYETGIKIHTYSAAKHLDII